MPYTRSNEFDGGIVAPPPDHKLNSRLVVVRRLESGRLKASLAADLVAAMTFRPMMSPDHTRSGDMHAPFARAKWPPPSSASASFRKNSHAQGNEDRPADIGRIRDVCAYLMGTNDPGEVKVILWTRLLLQRFGFPLGGVDRHRIFLSAKTGTFSVSEPIEWHAATFANGGTHRLSPPIRPAAADSFHAAGIAHGGTRPAKSLRLREGGG